MPWFLDPIRGRPLEHATYTEARDTPKRALRN